MLAGTTRRVVALCANTARSLSLMDKIPFFKKKQEDSNWEDVTAERTQSWYDEELPSEEAIHEVLKPLALKHLGATEDTWQDAPLTDLKTKFKVLTQCIGGLGRDIPSSQLVYLESVSDVIKYYQTPVQQPKYIELRPQSLPLNVKIMMQSIKKPLEQT